MKTDSIQAQNPPEIKPATRDIATQQLMDCMSHWSLEWRNELFGTDREAVSRILAGAVSYIEELEAALKPFSEAADGLDDDEGRDLWEAPCTTSLTVADLIRARVAYRVIADCESAGEDD